MAPSLPRRVALAVLLACIGLAAQVQDWPNRPLRILVGSSPGGGTDAMARVVADKLGPALGVPVVIENKPGASNTLAADATAKSTDGHTLVMGVSTAHAIAPYLFKLGYDNAKDHSDKLPARRTVKARASHPHGPHHNRRKQRPGRFNPHRAQTTKPIWPGTARWFSSTRFICLGMQPPAARKFVLGR